MAMAMTMSTTLLLMTLSTSSAAAVALNECDRCVDEKMNSIERTCADLPYSIDVNRLPEYKLNAKYHTCFCSIPSGSAWISSCNTSSKCSADETDETIQLLKAITGSMECLAGSASGNGGGTSGNGGASGNGTTTGHERNDANSGRAMMNAAAGVTAAAIVFTVLL
ncbi:hypothetical protein BGX24_008882 [Mortierella sp. AD032]|nr:hypothetical protein BGX24_008882 [Mortierella sp. AD032]